MSLRQLKRVLVNGVALQVSVKSGLERTRDYFVAEIAKVGQTDD